MAGPVVDSNITLADLPPSDGALLGQFVDARDADAFAAILRRHGPYILALAQRLTSHAQDAEDVFQACFWSWREMRAAFASGLRSRVGCRLLRRGSHAGYGARASGFDEGSWPQQ